MNEKVKQAIAELCPAGRSVVELDGTDVGEIAGIFFDDETDEAYAFVSFPGRNDDCMELNLNEVAFVAFIEYDTDTYILNDGVTKDTSIVEHCEWIVK